MSLSVVLSALENDTRRQILEVLREADPRTGLSVSAVAHHVELSRFSASFHLRVLREAGLVAVRVRAQCRLHTLRLAPIHDLEDWLGPFLDMNERETA